MMKIRFICDGLVNYFKVDLVQQAKLSGGLQRQLGVSKSYLQPSNGGMRKLAPLNPPNLPTNTKGGGFDVIPRPTSKVEPLRANLSKNANINFFKNVFK